jgi:hypothetical protein
VVEKERSQQIKLGLLHSLRFGLLLSLKLGLLLSLTFLISPLWAVSPHWEFRVLNSPHFEVIYRADQRALAERYALAGEQARELLLPIFKEAPDKTIIFITDETDDSNGMASFVPYPLITVYPVLPSTLDSIDDYGDWPLEMIVHEYTHILNMYPAHGFYVPLKWIFGDVIRPNAILPKWYLEGLAVNMESRLSDHGRLRADETRAEARALSLSHRLHSENIAQINEESLTTWPYGARPYMFGGWWWQHVSDVHGPQVIEDWNQDFARRIPFLLNGPMRERTGQSASELLSSTVLTLDDEAHREIATLEANKAHTATKTLSETGETSAFAVSPDGSKLAYVLGRTPVGNDLAVSAVIRVKTRRAHESFSEVPAQTMLKTDGTLRLRWLDEHRVLFDALDLQRPWVTYRDLYIYDMTRNQRIRITQDQRAQDPSPSPDAHSVVFVQNDGGYNRLMLLALNSSQAPRVLLQGSFEQRLSGPEYLNANEILYVRHERSGKEQIFVYNLQSQKSKLWNSHLSAAQNLRVTSKGVLVSDSGTHVRNIYLAQNGGAAPIAVTNTLTHIETADYDPLRKELLISELSGDGRILKSLPLDTYHPASLPPSALPAPPEIKTKEVQVSDESYQPFSYLRPRFWIPFVYNVENNGWLFQGSTFNSDPAGRNSYSAFASIDTITQDPSYGLTYTNSSTPVDIGVSYERLISYLGASSYTLKGQYATLDFSQFWPFNDRSFKWDVGGNWSELESGVAYRRIGPNVGFSFNRLQNPWNSWYGVLLEGNQTQYLPEGNYFSYGRSYLHMTNLFQLGAGQRVLLQMRAAYAPQLSLDQVVALGDRNIGANYLVSLVNSDFLLRGYPSGEFVGREIVNANLEYTLSLIDAFGVGTFPLYLRNLEMTLFMDTMAVDGGGIIPDRSTSTYFRTRLDQYFSSAGGELRFNTTVAYQMPVTFILGAYYGLNTQFGGGFMPFLGLGLGSLGNLRDKTP